MRKTKTRKKRTTDAKDKEVEYKDEENKGNEDIE